MSPSRKVEAISNNAAARAQAASLLALSLQPGPESLACVNPSGRRYCVSTCSRPGQPEQHLGYSDDYQRCAELAQTRANSLLRATKISVWQPTDDGGYWSSSASNRRLFGKNQRSYFEPGGAA